MNGSNRYVQRVIYYKVRYAKGKPVSLRFPPISRLLLPSSGDQVAGWPGCKIGNDRSFNVDLDHLDSLLSKERFLGQGVRGKAGARGHRGKGSGLDLCPEE